MKVIQIMPNFSLAGAEIMCENLVYALKNHGVDVMVVSFYTQHSAITDRMETAGVDVRYLDKKSGFDLSMIGKLKKIFKEEKPDVIHTHRYAMQYAIPAAVMAGVKGRVHTVHSVATKEMSKSKRTLSKFFYKHCGVVPVALSEVVRDSVVNEYKLSYDAVPIVYNGINLSNCCPKTDYSLNEKFAVLHIGRFVEVKNHPMLINAFAKFHQKYPNTVLQLIGDGEGRTSAEKLVDELGITDSVELLGLQSNVYGYLHDTDIFTLPSAYEGIPITLIEAMGTGLPIVATRVGGVPDMLDENSALLLDVEVDALAEAFEKYYLDESLRKSHGELALALSNRFSAETMAQKYISIYEGICT